jgi:hypothetical protein
VVLVEVVGVGRQVVHAERPDRLVPLVPVWNGFGGWRSCE